jgi:hypothetical protein
VRAFPPELDAALGIPYHFAPMEQRPPNGIEKLTIPGRLLLLVTVLLFAGGTYLTLHLVFEHFPTGSYPLFVILMPICIWCALFFLITARILERCGVRIYADRIRK